MSKRVAIHPRDIYDRIDDIIPSRFKGYTEKSIISNEGINFKDVTLIQILKIL